MLKMIVGTTLASLHLRLPAGLLPTPHSQRSPPPPAPPACPARRPSRLPSSPLPAPAGPARLSGRPLGALYKRPPGRWRPTTSLLVSGTAQHRGAGRLQRRPARCLAGSRSPSGLVSRAEASRAGEASPVPERGLGKLSSERPWDRDRVVWRLGDGVLLRAPSWHRLAGPVLGPAVDVEISADASLPALPSAGASDSRPCGFRNVRKANETWPSRVAWDPSDTPRGWRTFPSVFSFFSFLESSFLAGAATASKRR